MGCLTPRQMFRFVCRIVRWNSSCRSVAPLVTDAWSYESELSTNGGNE